MKEEYTIKELSEALGILPNKLRFYEKKGLLVPRRQENNYRVYIKEDLLKLQVILMYRYLGVSLDVIKDMLEESDQEMHRNELRKQRFMLQQKIDQMTLMQLRIDKVIESSISGKSSTASKEISEQIKYQELWKDNWNFDKWSKHYDVSIRQHDDVLDLYQHYDELFDYISSVFANRQGEEILDIGVGTGNLATNLYLEGHSITGVDQSLGMLEVAQSKLPHMPLHYGSFLALPFADNRFNHIVTTYAFHHLTLEEKDQAIDEMLRVITRDGLIVIGDLMFESYNREAALMAEYSQEAIETIEDEYFSNVDWFKSLEKKKSIQVESKPFSDILSCVLIKKKGKE